MVIKGLETTLTDSAETEQILIIGMFPYSYALALLCKIVSLFFKKNQDYEYVVRQRKDLSNSINYSFMLTDYSL